MPAPTLSTEPWRRRLYLPAYTVTEAARYARTSSGTVTYWHYGGGALGPALPGKQHGTPLSYLQLIEVAMVATFRELGVSLQRIRKAREYFAAVFNEEFPFTRYRLQTDGYHLLMDLQQVEPDAELERLVVADAHGQIGWKPLIGERFAEFDYANDLVISWHPAGRESTVVIDPRVSFGTPTIKGVPTWVIKGRSLAGESVEEIREDFALEEEDIQEALRFEGAQAA